MSGEIAFDESLFPLVLVHYRGTPDDAAQDAYFAHLDALGKRTERRFLVYLPDGDAAVPSRFRQRHAEWTRRNEQLVREQNLGVAFVLPNPLLRVLLRAVFALQPIGCPQRTVSTLEEALAWAVECFEQTGQAPAAQRIRVRYALSR